MFNKIIGVASCKGGVGKSMVSVNLAVYIANFCNKSVGLLDADIYGPSHPTLLGIKECTNIDNLIPQKKFGLLSMSIGYFLKDNSSVLLRGPIISNTINYLIKNTQWGNLDILIVDFPPGTGDIYLSLLRDFKIDGILVITTPQPISTIDTKKSILMLKKFNINILGIVENMASYTCLNCSFKNNIYGNNESFIQLTNEFNISKKYSINFYKNIIDSCNFGSPFAYDKNNSEAKEIIRNIALDIIDQLF